jgi:hypothetical protein
VHRASRGEWGSFAAILIKFPLAFRFKGSFENESERAPLAPRFAATECRIHKIAAKTTEFTLRELFMKENKYKVPKRRSDLVWDDAIAAIELKFATLVQALYAQTVGQDQENDQLLATLEKAWAENEVLRLLLNANGRRADGNVDGVSAEEMTAAVINAAKRSSRSF